MNYHVHWAYKDVNYPTKETFKILYVRVEEMSIKVCIWEEEQKYEFVHIQVLE